MANVVQGLIVSTLSVLLWFYSNRYADNRMDVLGPAFFPKMVAVIGFIMGLILISRKFRTYHVKDESVNTLAIWKGYAKTVVPVVILITISLAMFEYIGFILMTMFLLCSIAFFLGEKKYKRLAIYSVSLTAALYILFNKLLKIGLPDGFIGNLF